MSQTDDAAKRLERCCHCDEPTGRAGRGDDSLYDRLERGPYCGDCWDTLFEEAEAEIARLNSHAVKAKIKQLATNNNPDDAAPEWGPDEWQSAAQARQADADALTAKDAEIEGLRAAGGELDRLVKYLQGQLMIHKGMIVTSAETLVQGRKDWRDAVAGKDNEENKP